jgi:hypothetical protein
MMCFLIKRIYSVCQDKFYHFFTAIQIMIYVKVGECENRCSANALSASLSRALLLGEANFQVALQAAPDFRRDRLRIAAELDLGKTGIPLGDRQRRHRNPLKLRKPALTPAVIRLSVSRLPAFAEATAGKPLVRRSLGAGGFRPPPSPITASSRTSTT